VIKFFDRNHIIQAEECIVLTKYHRSKYLKIIDAKCKGCNKIRYCYECGKETESENNGHCKHCKQSKFCTCPKTEVDDHLRCTTCRKNRYCIKCGHVSSTKKEENTKQETGCCEFCNTPKFCDCVCDNEQQKSIKRKK